MNLEIWNNRKWMKNLEDKQPKKILPLTVVALIEQTDHWPLVHWDLSSNTTPHYTTRIGGAILMCSDTCVYSLDYSYVYRNSWRHFEVLAKNKLSQVIEFILELSLTEKKKRREKNSFQKIVYQFKLLKCSLFFFLPPPPPSSIFFRYFVFNILRKLIFRREEE